MKRVVVAIAIVLVLVMQSPMHMLEASDWSRVVVLLQVSTVPITWSLQNQNRCTAFSINRDQGLYMTVRHCTQTFPAEDGQTDVPQIGGKPLRIVFSNDTLDLAIVQADIHKPALRYRTKALHVGMEVAAYGYGYGMPVPILRTAVISAFLTDDSAAEWVLFDNALVRGMSGGPIVDRDGRVIGVSDQSDVFSGMSLSIRQILAATQFWQAE